MVTIVELFSSVINKNVSPPLYPDHPYGPDELQVSPLCACVRACIRVCVWCLYLCLCMSYCVYVYCEYPTLLLCVKVCTMWLP